MTLQNRVLPTGEIVAAPFRGTLMGNRGILHDDRQQLGIRRWQHPHWVTCVLEYKDWHRPVMTPHNYTELFFLDEPTALAAGHRPCGLCRRADHTRFRAAWARAHGDRSLDHDDRMLHSARVSRARKHQRHSARFADLPDGSFVWHVGAAHLVWGAHLLKQGDGGYTACVPRPETGRVEVLTPAPTVATLSNGYSPSLHTSARSLLGPADAP